MTCLKRSVAFAAKTAVLATTGITATTLLLVVFPALPIGGDLLDARFGYTCAEALEAMAAYGEVGRRVYLVAGLTLDTLLPVAYVGFFAGLVYRLRTKDRLWTLSLVPFGAGLLDLGENAQIAAMLVSYPNISPLQVAAASLSTQTKTIALLTSLAIVAALAVTRLARTPRERR